MKQVLVQLHVDTNATPVDRVGSRTYMFNQKGPFQVLLWTATPIVRTATAWETLAKLLPVLGLGAAPPRASLAPIDANVVRTEVDSDGKRSVTLRLASRPWKRANTEPATGELHKWRKSSQRALPSELLAVEPLQQSAAVASATNGLSRALPSSNNSSRRGSVAAVPEAPLEDHTKCLLQRNELQRSIDRLESQLAEAMRNQAATEAQLGQTKRALDRELASTKDQVLSTQIDRLEKELQESTIKLRDTIRIHRERQAEYEHERLILTRKFEHDLQEAEATWKRKLDESEKFHAKKDADLRKEMDNVIKAEREAVETRVRADLSDRLKHAETRARSLEELESNGRALQTDAALKESRRIKEESDWKLQEAERKINHADRLLADARTREDMNRKDLERHLKAQAAIMVEEIEQKLRAVRRQAIEAAAKAETDRLELESKLREEYAARSADTERRMRDAEERLTALQHRMQLERLTHERQLEDAQRKADDLEARLREARDRASQAHGDLEAERAALNKRLQDEYAGKLADAEVRALAATQLVDQLQARLDEASKAAEKSREATEVSRRLEEFERSLRENATQASQKESDWLAVRRNLEADLLAAQNRARDAEDARTDADRRAQREINDLQDQVRPRERERR